MANWTVGSWFQLGHRLAGWPIEPIDSLPALECKDLWLEIVTEEVLKVWTSLKRGGMGEDHKSVEKLTHIT